MAFTQSSATATSPSAFQQKIIDEKNIIQRPFVLAALLAMPLVFTAIWLANGLVPFTWDAAWYRSVASDGYQFDGNILRPQNVAFLPGYPAALFVFNSITKVDLPWSQYFVSLLCYLLGSACFYKAFRRWFGPTQSALIIFIFSANPFAIYLFNGYSETFFYLLCGIFFLGVAIGQLWLSTVALSIALVTRPHAIALYPVLIFLLAMRSRRYSDEIRTPRSMARGFVISAVDYVSLSLIFPLLLIAFWYVKFGDTFLYVNALSAWASGSTGGAFAKIEFVGITLADLNPTVDTLTNGVRMKVLTPSYFAALHVAANFVAILFLLHRKLYEIALFSLGLLVFWLLTSSYGDSGRQLLMLFAAPTAMSFALMPSGVLQSGAIGRATLMKSLLKIVMVLFSAIYILIAFCHFVAYAMIQIRGGWIS